LLDHLARHFTPAPPHESIGAQLTTRHRLQAFSPYYFEPETPNRLFSYSQENARAAAQKLTPGQWEKPLACVLTRRPVEKEVTLAGLIDALTQTARFFARARLGLAIPSEEAAVEDAEPITLDGLGRFDLAGRITATRLAGDDPAALLAPTRADGALPHGYTGDSAFYDADATARQLAAAIARHAPGPALAPQEISVAMDDWVLAARLAPFTATALVSYRPGKLRARDRLAAWLAHLTLCAAAPVNIPLRTVAIGADLAVAFPTLEPKTARQQLAQLLALYERVQSEALPLFPESSLVFVEYRLNLSGNLSRKPIYAAEDRWHGSKFSPQPPESDDPWNALVWRGQGDPLNEDFERIALAVFEPLLRAQQVGGTPPPPPVRGGAA
jgi:exodeoxyribonuclease V gamma subunit